MSPDTCGDPKPHEAHDHGDTDYCLGITQADYDEYLYDQAGGHE